MLDAVARALAQMFTPPFRSVLLKSIGLALILIVLIGVGLHHALVWLGTLLQAWAGGALGPYSETPIWLLAKMVSLAVTLGIVAGSVFLMPAVTALVASFFADDIALEVEREHYPAEPPGQALPISRAMFQGSKTALLAVLVYLVALPFLLFGGLGAAIFFLATAFLLSREYFELAAMRFHPPAEARRLRKAHQTTVLIAGLFIAGFVSIPVVSLATPLFGMALMVHVHKRIMSLHPQIERMATGSGSS
jgi:CysZ protein